MEFPRGGVEYSPLALRARSLTRMVHDCTDYTSSTAHNQSECEARAGLISYAYVTFYVRICLRYYFNMLRSRSALAICTHPVLYLMSKQTRLTMTTTKQQVAKNLCYLMQDDYAFTNEIILEYLNLVDNNRLNDLLEFTNTEMRANV